ncbi:MAG: hypothetical protein ACRDBI_03030, partial [Shewanella sp.]
TGLGLAQSLQSFSFALAATAPADGIEPAVSFEQIEQAWEPMLALGCDAPPLRELLGGAEAVRLYPSAPILGENIPKTHQWQSYLGRLTSQYRFAVSLGQVGPSLVSAAFEGKLCSIDDLLDAY